MSKILERNLRGILHEITRFRSIHNFHHISINTCAMISEWSGPYFTVRLAKFFDAFDDILSFISYSWRFLINGISPVIPPRKTQIPTITRNDILPEASRVSMASMNQMQLQVVGVRKSKFYTSIEFYIYQISLSKYSFQNDYSYFSWLHYVCFLSKNAKLCEYWIDVQSKWNIIFMLS